VEENIVSSWKQISATEPSLEKWFNLTSIYIFHLSLVFSQGISTRRQRENLFGFWVKLEPSTTGLPLKGCGILLSVFPKDTTSELTGLFSTHYAFNVVNVEQESCEYKFF